jgi:hypothetical protein
VCKNATNEWTEFFTSGTVLALHPAKTRENCSMSEAQAQGGLRYYEWSITIQGESNGKVFQRQLFILAPQAGQKLERRLLFFTRVLTIYAKKGKN